ncbi:MAG TPA: nuclear transport factor 2 family protein [Solirubrobacteraceae bacterium]|jgi:ketosteroid isomerase-like protein
MSQENVELAKRWEEAFTRYDWAAIDTLMTFDFEWFPALAGVLEGHGYHGREGFARYVRELEQTWADLLVFVVEFRDLGDRVVSLGRMEGRGRASGVTVDRPVGTIYDFRGGKLSRVRVVLAHEEALRVAGLAD